MPDSDLLTIGAFARSCGLSASALRFYADAGVLVPALVDESTGYRYYTLAQAATARLIRHLRAVDMPLPTVAAVLAESDPARALALVDDHLADLNRHLDAVRAAATAARAAFLARTTHPTRVDLDAEDPAKPPTEQSRGGEVVWVRGPHLAAAIDQIATATVADPKLPVLNSIHLESTATDLILTATDRYRLATRTLRPARPSTAPWTATIDADDLRDITSWLRREHTIALGPTPTHLDCTAVDSGDTAHDPTTDRGSSAGSTRRVAGRHDAGPFSRQCRRSTEPFPDYRAMLAGLPAVTTRVVVPRAVLLDVLERSGAPTITLRAEATGAVRATFGSETWQLPATATGPALTIHFAVTTLYPAVSCSFGPDLLVDLSAADRPALLRAADDGTLLTLVMPRRAESARPSVD